MNPRPGQASQRRLSNLSERAEYRLVVGLAFLLCLTGVLWRRLAGHRNTGESVFAEAHSAAMAAVGYAFIT